MKDIAVLNLAGCKAKSTGLWRMDSVRLTAVFGVSLAIHAMLLALPSITMSPEPGSWAAIAGNGRTLDVTLEKTETLGPAAAAIGLRDASAPLVEDELPKWARRYFPQAELDGLPVVDLSADSSRLNLPSGEDVVFRLWVDRRGHVTKVEPVTPELSQSLIAQVRERYMQMRFTPGLKKGYAVASIVDVSLPRATIGDRV